MHLNVFIAHNTHIQLSLAKISKEKIHLRKAYILIIVDINPDFKKPS